MKALFFILDFLLVGIFLLVFRFFPPPFSLPCTDALARDAILAFGMIFIIHLLVARRFFPHRVRTLLVFDLALLLVVAWLGLYPVSPLGFATLRGFAVTTTARGRWQVPPGGMVTLASGTAASVEALTLVNDVRCTWFSTRGGTLDEAQGCATVYIPPQEDFDVVKVNLKPGCGLPRSVEQLKIGILP